MVRRVIDDAQHNLPLLVTDGVEGEAAASGRLLDAVALAKSGKHAEARRVYLELLQEDPDNRQLLTNLGRVLINEGRLRAARVVFDRVIALYPGDVSSHLYLGHLSREGGDLHLAERHYRLALTGSPDLIPAHQGLAYLLDDLGRHLEGEDHRHRAFLQTPLVSSPFLGSGSALSVIVLLSAVGGNTPTQAWMDLHRFQVHSLFPAYVPPGWALPPHHLVFNAIADPERDPNALARSSQLLAQTHTPVVNHPDLIPATSRQGVGQLLSGCDGIVIPNTVKISRRGLSQSPGAADQLMRQLGFSYPLLLRSPGFHAGRHLARIGGPDQLVVQANALPGDDLLAIQFIDTQSVDGLYRKYRVLFIDGQVFPWHLAISAKWMVHYYSRRLPAQQSDRAEEDQFLADMPKALGTVVMDQLRLIQRHIRLNYAGIDFGISRTGELVVFELNAAMTVALGNRELDQTPLQAQAALTVHAALNDMLMRAISMAP